MKNIQRLISTGVYLIIAAIPLSFVIRASRGDLFRLELKVSVFDILIPLVFLLWIVKVLVLKEHGKIKYPAAPIIAFIIASMLSVVNAVVVLNSFKEMIQVVGYFLIAYLLFINNIKTGDQLRKVVYILTGITLLVSLYGAYQHIAMAGKPYLVSSAFDNRNILGGYLSIVLPLFFGLLLTSHTAMRILYGAVILCGLAVMTSVPSFIVIGLTFLSMSVLRRMKRMFVLSILAVFVIIALLPAGFSLGDEKGFFHEPGGLEGYHNGLVRSVEMSYFGSISGGRLGDYKLELVSGMATPKVISKEYIEKQLNARRKNVTFGEGGHIAQRFMEWQAALNGLTERPLLGIGVGNYQFEIGDYYRFLPKLKTMEPDSQNGYLITLVSTGLTGLVVFMWILFHFFRLSIANLTSPGDDFTKGMSLGLLGSLIAFSLGNLFSPLIYQNTVMLFVLVLSLISIVRSYPDKDEVDI